MSAVGYYIWLTLRLHARNRMALLYNYLFPTFFLVAFATLYRHERVPLAAHLGELLTVTILGGACFGLPTTLVSERERGVWRRYRLLPVPLAVPVLGALASRLLLTAAVLLQLALTSTIGFPGPEHWIDLSLAAAVVGVAFIGLGLVIAACADSVPAVQALGQCVFLPMLIVGGVAVPLVSLPAWAQQASLLLPGRYAVDVIQSSVTSAGHWRRTLQRDGVAHHMAPPPAARVSRSSAGLPANTAAAPRGRTGWAPPLRAHGVDCGSDSPRCGATTAPRPAGAAPTAAVVAGSCAASRAVAGRAAAGATGRRAASARIADCAPRHLPRLHRARRR